MIIKRPHRKTLTTLQRFISRSLSPPVLHLNDTQQNSIDPYSFAEAIIEAVHEPIVILDKSLTVVAANTSLFKTFKVSRKNLLGKEIRYFVKENPQIQTLIEKLHALSIHKSSFDEIETTFIFPKLGERTLLINARRIEIGSYATDLILLRIQDITQRKIIEQQKDDFVGYVTHELKTPITTVVAFVQILQRYHEKTTDKKSQFLLAKINIQMERLTRLLNSFSNVYKAQSGLLTIHKKRFDFNKLVHEVVETFQYMTSTHELIIKGSVSKPVLADRERLYEVLVNLITNAIKYSPNADKVIIKMTEEPGKLQVSIQDFGVGIAREEQQKVFERFFRVKSKTKLKIEGVGLGLYLAASIIMAHKGKLWVESVEDKGSTFLFTLPLKG